VSATVRALRRLAARLLLALLVGAVFFEVSLRVLLTSPWTRDSVLAREVGSPARFAFGHEDLYWRFVDRLRTPEAPQYEPPADELLGWTWPDVRPGTYAHAELAALGARRPVLLFGDSFSACLTPRDDCFQGLMERSSLGGRCQLLNYGACGYGFDQTVLLAREVAERYGELDPVLVIGLLVDDDLSRMRLSLREYPKPRLRLVNGRLEVTGLPVPSRAEYRVDPAPLPMSWAWVWLRQALREDPLDDPASPERRELEDLTRALMVELVGDLRARGLEHCFLLFHVAATSRPGVPDDWRTRLVRDVLEDLGAPWYDVRTELRRRVTQEGAQLEDFYIPRDQPGGGHYGPAGNAVAFEVLRHGLRDVAGLQGEPGERAYPWGFRTTLGDAGASANYLAQAAAPLDRIPGPCITLRAPGTTPTTITYALDAQRSRFTAHLWAFQPAGEDDAFALTARLDGRELWSGAVRATQEPLALDLDLRGGRTLELSLAPHARRGMAVLAEPRFE